LISPSVFVSKLLARLVNIIYPPPLLFFYQTSFHR
jgi:hypothetical protein